MIQTKKLVCGTRRALDKEIEAHKSKGWTVERIEAPPRGKLTSALTYVVFLTRNTDPQL